MTRSSSNPHAPNLLQAHNVATIARADFPAGWAPIQTWLRDARWFDTPVALRSLRHKYAAIDVLEEDTERLRRMGGVFTSWTPRLRGQDLEDDLRSLTSQMCESCGGPGGFTTTDSGWEQIACRRCAPPEPLLDSFDCDDERQDHWDHDDDWDGQTRPYKPPTLEQDVRRYQRARPAMPFGPDEWQRLLPTPRDRPFEDRAFWVTRLIETPPDQWRTHWRELLNLKPTQTAGFDVELLAALLLHPDFTTEQRRRAVTQWGGVGPPQEQRSRALALAEVFRIAPSTVEALPPERLIELLGTSGCLAWLQDPHPAAHRPLTHQILRHVWTTTGFLPPSLLLQWLRDPDEPLEGLADTVPLLALPDPWRLLAQVRLAPEALTPERLATLSIGERLWLLEGGLPLSPALRTALLEAETAIQTPSRGDLLVLRTGLTTLTTPRAASTPDDDEGFVVIADPTPEPLPPSLLRRLLAHPHKDVRLLGLQHLGQSAPPPSASSPDRRPGRGRG